MNKEQTDKIIAGFEKYTFSIVLLLIVIGAVFVFDQVQKLDETVSKTAVDVLLATEPVID